MNQNLYNDLEKQLSTADLLAIERNKLAQERTLLAYVRTFLSFVVAGASLIQFFESKTFITFGYVLIPLSLAILIVGIIRFTIVTRKIDQIRNKRV